MKLFLAALLSLVSMLAQGQLITDSMLVEGRYRTFRYYQPLAKLNSGNLLFVMHGSGGSSMDMIKKTTRLEAIAAREKLMVVYPDGYLRYWNECRKYATSAANKENINEQAFFTALINYFHDKFGIDKHHVFATGFSGGGQMAYKLGLTMPSNIKAIAAIVANMPATESCDCTAAGKPLPVLIVNGTKDNVNPDKGGEMFVNNASYGVVLSTEGSFRYWSTLAGYKGSPEKTLLADKDTADGKTIEQYSFRQPQKPPVTLLKVIGGGHDYPNDIDVYLYVWDFFKSVK